MSGLRLFGGIAGLLLALSVAWLCKDRFHQKSLADAAAACAKAATTDSAPLDACLQPVAERVASARQSAACEEALLPSLRPENRFRVLNSCGAGVKRLVAERDAAITGQEDLSRQLDEARADTASAIARAEGRAITQQERNRRASDAIASAPRGAGGGIACDADCLRRIAD